jgi:uncharacterized membrane protein (DUF106 family)
MKSMNKLLLVMALSLVIAFYWTNLTFIKTPIHAALDPTAGKLLGWNANIGMIVIAAIIGLAIILVQKYTTDQKTLREIKKEQKLIQEEIKKYKHDQEKFLELNKKQMALLPKTMDITLRPVIYTSVPIILFFRWFNDYFAANPVKIFGFLSWIWAYLILSIIFTSIFRKVFDVA